MKAGFTPSGILPSGLTPSTLSFDDQLERPEVERLAEKLPPRATRIAGERRKSCHSDDPAACTSCHRDHRMFPPRQPRTTQLRTARGRA